MKKILLLLTALFLAGCQSVSSQTVHKIDNSQTKIAMMTQEYIGDNIVEIPYIDYDGANPSLKEYNGKNPQIDEINQNLKTDIQQSYLHFLENKTENEWIEIYTYPFTNEEYIQIVVTKNTFPTYGTDGEIYSYNFNKKTNDYITLEEILSQQNLTKDDIVKTVKDLFVPELPTISIEEVNIAGFLLSNDDTYYLLEMKLDNSQSEPWTNFFCYASKEQQLKKISPLCLFDPVYMDKMEPPLKCNSFMSDSYYTYE